MAPTDPLVPAQDLARHSKKRFPNESAGYRAARTALLAEEIRLRRQLEQVAVQRRALPLGGEVPQDYVFEGAEGPVRLSALFGDSDTLITYNFMFGPERKQACPMCTSMLGALDGEMPDILQRVPVVIVARSPIARLQAFAQERGWRHLRFASSGGNDFNRHYADEEPGKGDNAGFNVFVRRGGKIHHFWGDEMGFESADPGQDPRGAPEIMPIWILLDMTPGGRGTDWYPALHYSTPPQG